MKPLTALALVASSLALGALAGCSGPAAQPDVLPRSAHVLQDHRLNTEQRGAAASNGFVIATDAPADSFHMGYTSLFKAHQPVYITADAVLHALHSSFDHLLADIEVASLSKQLTILLNELRAGLANSTEGSPAARADLDLYLAVAASLESGGPAAPVAGASKEAIVRTTKLGEEAAGPAEIDLFGEKSLIELSMLKPRGHYTRSEGLQRYFRAMMWLGRTEIRIAKKSSPSEPWEVNRRALEGAAILARAFAASPRAEAAWRAIDDATRGLIGPADSMSFPGLSRALSAMSVASPADLARVSDADVTRALEPESSQRISSQLLYPGQHPIAFVPLGQRYVFDSHVFEEVTYGKLDVKRMMPSPLDVASAVFKNPIATGLLKPEIERFHYKNALDAIAARGDAMGPELWGGSLLHGWLGALRELSPRAESSAGLPAVMKTEAWGRRLLNTQLASWAELRHDTLLYAKQSFSAMALCEYPSAYVEPYPKFFTKLVELSTKTAALMKSLDLRSDEALRARIVGYFDKFGGVAKELGAMAELERKGEPLRPEHLDFINRAVSVDGRSAGCTTVLEPGGWYADLYYDRSDVLAYRPTIADVHTQPTDEQGNMVGKVLHVGTAKPRLFVVTIDTCSGPTTYRGFVASYHERVTSGFVRLTDEEWWSDISKSAPAEAPWLSGILAP